MRYLAAFAVSVLCLTPQTLAQALGSRGAYDAVRNSMMSDQFSRRKEVESLLDNARKQAQIEMRPLMNMQLKAGSTLEKLVGESRRQKADEISSLQDSLKKMSSELAEMKRGRIGEDKRATISTLIGGTSFDVDPVTHNRRYFAFKTALAKKQAIASQQKQVDETKADLAKLQKDDYISVPLLPVNKLEVGRVGVLYFPKGMSLASEDGRGFLVIYIDGPNDMLAEIGEKPVWIKGVSTSGLVDQSRVVLPQLFHVAGTKKYKTNTGGTSTVFLLQALNLRSAAQDAL
jgi:hypothetical protein